jgi:hypothetical protein
MRQKTRPATPSFRYEPLGSNSTNGRRQVTKAALLKVAGMVRESRSFSKHGDHQDSGCPAGFFRGVVEVKQDELEVRC